MSVFFRDIFSGKILFSSICLSFCVIFVFLCKKYMKNDLATITNPICCRLDVRFGNRLNRRIVKNIVAFVAAVIAAMLLGSCATFISGTTATIVIDGDVDEPLTITTSHATYTDVALPARVKVKRRHIDGQHIRLSSDSYAYSDIVLRQSVNVTAVVCACLTAFSLLPDLLTNAVSEPTQTHYYVVPDASIEAADSLHRADSLRIVKAEGEQKLDRRLPTRYKRHHFSGGIGFGEKNADRDLDKFIDPLKEKYGVISEDRCFDFVGDSYLLANMEYHYRLNRRWEVGGMAAWGLSRDLYTDTDPYIPNKPWFVNASELSRYFAVAPSVRFTWTENDAVRLYSRLALGYMRHHLSFRYNREKPSPDGLNSSIVLMTESTERLKHRLGYQLTVVGGVAEVGHLHLFGEVGYGCLGLVRLGLGMSF